jgi:hypothetical protein
MDQLDLLMARIRELNEENANLKRLVAANRLLAGAPLPEKVLSYVEEIVFGMIGARELVVFDMDFAAQALKLVFFRGIDSNSPRLSEALPLLADVVSCGEILVTTEEEARMRGGLTAAVPLRVDGTVTGLIAIFRLTDGKTDLDPLDLELLDLIGAQAAIPLHARSHSSERPTVRPPKSSARR